MNESERQRADERWEQRFSELERYIRILGHARISRADFANTALRTWLRTQQQMAKAGTLPTERWWRLTGLGLELLGNDERWERRFAQLRQFRERFGHCRVLAKWKEDVPFGQWVHVQRAFRRKGLLSAERIARLEAVGFQWHGPRDSDHVPRAGWAEMAARLAAWKQEHGTARVSSRPGSENLRRWVDKQRQAARNGTLRADRRERLDTIGFDWAGARADLDAHWERRFAQLLAFRERFGHCRVSAKWKEDSSLGQWVHEQRSTRKKGILKAERLRRLDEIGFQWAK